MSEELKKVEWRSVLVDASYDMRVAAIIAHNQCKGDLDDKLQAAWAAMLAASPPPPEDGWKPMSSAPQTEHTPFLVYLPRTMAGSREVNEPCIVQVSRFEGNLYPDAMQHVVDWSNRITSATAWRALPPPPAALEPKEQQ